MGKMWWLKWKSFSYHGATIVSMIALKIQCGPGSAFCRVLNPVQFDISWGLLCYKPSGKSPGSLPLPSHNLNPLEQSLSPKGIKIQHILVFTLWQLVYKVIIRVFCVSPLICCILGIPHRILNQIGTRYSARYFHKYPFLFSKFSCEVVIIIPLLVMREQSLRCSWAIS